MNDKIFAAYKDKNDKIHFMELNEFKEFIGVYSESHLKLCYKAIKDSKLL